MDAPNRIRELRRKARMTQADLGQMVGLSQGQIGNIETGGRNVSFEWMKRVAEALGCTIADLLLDEDNPERSDAEHQAAGHLPSPNRIRELRIALGLSQVALGDRVGRTGGQVSHLENGVRNLTVEWMLRIARALGATPADLLVDADNPDRLSEDERAVIAAMRAMGPVARRYIQVIVTALAGNDDQSSPT